MPRAAAIWGFEKDNYGFSGLEKEVHTKKSTAVKTPFSIYDFEFGAYA